jgi:hypothetical protein
MMKKKNIGRLLNAVRQDRKRWEKEPKSHARDMNLMYLDGKIWALEEVLKKNSLYDNKDTYETVSK